jgi:hypothetical protein
MPEPDNRPVQAKEEANSQVTADTQVLLFVALPGMR